MFTSSISVDVKTIGSANTLILKIQNIIFISKGNFGYGPINIGGTRNNYITSLNFNLPAAVNLYDKANAQIYVYGKVDDYIRFYLNNNLIHSSTWGWNCIGCFIETMNPTYINAGTDTFNVSLSQQNNKLDIYCFSGDPTYLYIYSLKITVTTISK